MKLTDHNLEIIEFKCPVYSINFNWANITEKALDFLSQKCPNLETIQLQGLYLFSGINKLTNCGNLKYLNLSDTSGLPFTEVQQIILNCHKLERISLRSVYGDNSLATFKDLFPSSAVIPNLLAIQLTNYTEIPNLHIIFPNLETIIGISVNSDIKILSSRWSNLKFLHLSSSTTQCPCHPTTMASLENHLPKLQIMMNPFKYDLEKVNTHQLRLSIFPERDSYCVYHYE